MAAAEAPLPEQQATVSSNNNNAVALHEIAIDGGAKKPITLTDQDKDKTHLGIRLVKGKSVVTMSGLLTASEIQDLQQSSIEAASHQTIPTNQNDRVGRVCIRMPTQAAASRQDIPDAGTQDLHDPLPQELSEAVEETILKRTMAYIDDNLPELVQTLFGCKLCNSF